MGCNNIFSAKPGRIVKIEGDQKLFGFSVTGCDGDAITSFFGPFKAICTAIGIQGQGGYQFMHTLSDFIYLYVFNERVGQIVFSGLAFATTCDEFDGTTGMEWLLGWYDHSRVTSCPTSIAISLGKYTFTAFLTSFKIDVINPESGIAQFALTFTYVPNISPKDPCAGGATSSPSAASASAGAPTTTPSGTAGGSGGGSGTPGGSNISPGGSSISLAGGSSSNISLAGGF